jgi:predicted dehydrogenase
MMAMRAALNPLRLDPSFVVLHELVTQQCMGQVLAISAAARSREPVEEPLVALGLPLIDALLWIGAEDPVSVTAVTIDGNHAFQHWSLVVTFPSGLRASVDVGSGLGPAQVEELMLRAEWCGTERAVSAEPWRVAVTVVGAHGAQRRSAEVSPVADALLAFAETARAIAADPPDDWRAAAAVIDAARRSTMNGTTIRL